MIGKWTAFFFSRIHDTIARSEVRRRLAKLSQQRPSLRSVWGLASKFCGYAGRKTNRSSLPVATGSKVQMCDHSLTEKRVRFLKDDYERGFVKFCRLKAVHAEWGKFQSRVEIEEDHRQQDGFIHAGVMATMADHTAGYSAFTIVPEEMQILTIEFKINFLRPAFGRALVCSSQVIREGRQIIVSESTVFDDRGENQAAVAKATVTLLAVPRESLLNDATSTGT
jgi:uncharacterized protein (TIGR00369 family)